MDSFLLTFGLVFIAGLLASATPCVYPMLPITAAIFAARGEGSRRYSRLHAVVYFVGVIFFYTLLGFVATITGTALSAIMTNAWIHFGFAGLFAYLGLSMLVWEMELRRPVLRTAARFGRPVMEWGHDWVVSTGFEQFCRSALRVDVGHDNHDDDRGAGTAGYGA
jgi:thiol:disulfide interchange protein